MVESRATNHHLLILEQTASSPAPPGGGSEENCCLSRSRDGSFLIYLKNVFFQAAREVSLAKWGEWEDAMGLPDGWKVQIRVEMTNWLRTFIWAWKACCITKAFLRCVLGNISQPYRRKSSTNLPWTKYSLPSSRLFSSKDFFLYWFELQGYALLKRRRTCDTDFI